MANEHFEQSTFIHYVKLKLEPFYPECKWLYSIPNGAKFGTNKLMAIRQAQYLKEEGLKVGVSDLCLPVTRYKEGGLWCFMGLYMEFKQPPNVSPVRGNVTRNKPTDEQQEFIDFAREQGYVAECVNGLDEAVELMTWYLELVPVSEALSQVESYEHIYNKKLLQSINE